jgi:hypothetical protein
MEDSWSDGGRKRNQAGELDDEPRRRKVAATLSGDEVTSFIRGKGSASTTQQRPQSAGAAYASLLQAGNSGDLQHRIVRGQHASVEDTLQRQVSAQPFQSIFPYSGMLQQQQQQLRQAGKFLSEASVATASTSIQAMQAQMLEGFSGQSSHRPLLSGLRHLPRQQMHLPIAPVPNATQVSQAQNFQAFSESDILQLLQQQQLRQGISSAASESETHLQQHLHSASSLANAFTSSPLSQAEILQALGGQSILMQQIQSQQGFFSAAPAAESSVQQSLQLPVASTSNVSTSSETSQAQFMQDLLQRIQSQQELSSTAAAAASVAATESNTPHQQMQVWRQNVALLAARENALRNSGMTDQTSPSNQGDHANTRLVASAPPSLPSSGITMWLPDDTHQLSEYQISVRQQLDIFEAEQEDCESNIQGRKRQVIPGQAGIRCRHCSNLPLRLRGRGAVYYPLKLSGVYQAAQNMASSHLADCCSQIPDDIKQELRDLRHRRDTAFGGKKYWAEAGRASGLYETEECLRLRPGAAP